MGFYVGYGISSSPALMGCFLHLLGAGASRAQRPGKARPGWDGYLKPDA
jgi:hypothetical protein